MSTPACPEPARLAEYCLGKLPWEELERLEQHLDDCPSCQQTLNQLERPSDTFVRKMRAGEVAPAVAQAPAVAAPPAPPHLHENELKAALARALQAPQPNDQPQPSPPSGIGKAGGEKPRDSRIPQTVADFLQLLTASQLMSASEAQAFLDSLPPRHQPADAKAAAALFAHACKLTPYQARALYQGKPNNLLIADREVLDLLGKGGMGNVFKARNRRLDRLEAIKVISSKKLESPDAKERFSREARAAARLNHPNVVATYDAGEVNGVNFLSMEFVDGLDLSKTIKQRGPLSPEQAVNCILQAAAGLQAAHDAGIIHRDIKPHNLLLDRQGQVKVLDLGLARMNDSANLAANEGLTQSGQVMGTIDYMSPEQTLDVRKVTPASDVYSLGCTLHYLLTGRPPFAAETLGAKMLAHHHEAPPSLTAVCPQASPALDAVFQKMLAKDPAHRYATMNDVIAALQSLTQHAAPDDQPLLPPPLPSEEKEDRKLSEFLSVMAVSQELPPPLVRQKPAPQFAASTVAADHPSRALSPAVALQQPGNSAYSPAQIFLAALLTTLLLGGVGLFAVILWIRTLYGTIEIKLGEGVKPADVEIVLKGDGEPLTITEKDRVSGKDGFNVKVWNGKYEVALGNKTDRLTLDKKSLEITRNEIVALSVTQIPTAPPPPPPPPPTVPPPPGWTDLLALIDPSKQAKVGPWERVENRITTQTPNNGQRIYSPSKVDRSYQLECELEVHSGSDCGLLLPVGDATALLALWHAGGTKSMLQLSREYPDRIVEVAAPPQPRSPIKVSVSVQLSADHKQALIQADATGHPPLVWKGPVSGISFQQSDFWNPRPHFIGLIAHGSTVTYHKLLYRIHPEPHLPPDDPTVHPATGDELAPDKWYDLLPEVDVNKHILNSEAVRDAQGITFTRGHGTHFLAPFTASGSYDVRCKFTRVMGGNELQLALPLGRGAATTFMLSSHGGAHGGLAVLRGKLVRDEGRTEGVIRPSPLTNGKPHDCLVSVDLSGDNVSISAELDGASVMNWSGPRAELASWDWMTFPRADLLGVGAAIDLTVVHAYHVRPRGEPLRRWNPSAVLANEPPPEIQGECVRWNGHWYWSSQARMSLPAAIALANKHGGRLVEICSASEHRFLCNQYPDRELFLGAWRDWREPEPRKAWLNNRFTPLPYSGPWGENQPEMQIEQTTLFLSTRGAGEWHDHSAYASLHLCIEWGDEGLQNGAEFDSSPVASPLPNPPFEIQTNGLGGRKTLLPMVWPNAWREDGQFAHVRGPGTIWYPAKTFFGNLGFSYAVDLDFTCNPGRGTLNIVVGDNLDCNLWIPIDVQHVADNPERCDIKLFNWLNEDRWHWGHHEFKVGTRKRLSILVNESLYAAVENSRVILRGHGAPSYPALRLGTDSESLDVVIHRCEIRPLAEPDILALRPYRWKAPPFDPSLDKATASARWRQRKEVWQKQNEGLENKPLKDKPFITAATQTPLIWIPAGSFGMGWTPPERPAGWKTEITKPYWIGKYEITQQEWSRVMPFGNPSRLEFPYLPVGNVTYAQCLAFCSTLTEREQANIPPGYEYRLPTEAEWEYACRAGRTGEYKTPPNEAWTIANSDWRPHDVGESTANPWGIYDMLGNQFEWCLDAWYDYPASSDLRKDPFTPPTTWHQRRICRGGSWWLLDGSTPWGRWSHYDVPGGYRGFRIVLGPKLTDKIPPQALDLFTEEEPAPPTALPAALRVPVAGQKMEVGKWYDLLETVDVKKHAINGLWKRDGAEVISHRRDENRLIAPVRIVGNYEIQAQFSRSGVADAINLGLPLPTGGYTNIDFWGWQGQFSGLAKVDGKMLSDHPDSTPWRIKTPGTRERRYTTLISVKSDGQKATLSATLDGAPFWYWEGLVSQLAIDPGAPPPRCDQPLLGTWTHYRIHDWRVRLLSGEGERLYDGTPAAAKEPPAAIKARCDFWNGRAYWISPNPVDIGEAMRLAGKYQAKLLTINSAAEEEFIKTTFPGKDIRLGAWRNANDPDPRTGWVDGDLKPLKYFNWSPGQPDGYQTTLTVTAGAWHDSDPGWPFHAVLEWGSEQPPIIVSGPRPVAAAVSPPPPATPPRASLAPTEPNRSSETFLFKGHRVMPSSAAFSPSGLKLVTTPYLMGHPDAHNPEDFVRVWNLTTGLEIARFEGPEGNVHRAEFSPNGNQVLVAANDSLRIFDANSGKETRRFKGHTDWVTGCAWSPTGTAVISCGRYDNTMRLWSVTTGEELKRFEHPDAVWSVAYSPVAPLALSACKDGIVRLWSLTTGKEIAQLRDHQEMVWRVVLSGDGRFALSSGGEPGKAGKDFAVRYWNVSERKLAAKLAGHTAVVTELGISQDGKVAISGTETDGTIVWNLSSGKEHERLPAGANVSLAAISPDGRTAAVPGKNEHEVAIWQLSPVGESARQETATARNGLSAEYFRGLNFETSVLKRVDPQLDFCWGFDAPGAEVPPDGWSARWNGWIKVPQPGTYRFAVLNDDGLRIWLDDKLVVDDWRGHYAERREFTVDLTAAPHAVRVEYYEDTLTAFLTWRYRTPDGREAPVPAEWLFPDRAGAEAAAVRHPPVARLTPRNGLKAEYFRTAELTDLLESRTEPQIDHLWGFDNPRPSVPPDGFAVRWSGWLLPPVAGEYQLAFWIDNRGVVQLDDRPAVHAPQDGPTRIVAARQLLEVRPYKIEVIAVEGDLTAIASLRWTPPGETRSVPIPPECFFVSPPPKRSP